MTPSLALQFDAREIHYLGKIGETPRLSRPSSLRQSVDGMGGAKTPPGISQTHRRGKNRAPVAPSFQASAAVCRGYDELRRTFDPIHAASWSSGAAQLLVTKKECRGR